MTLPAFAACKQADETVAMPEPKDISEFDNIEVYTAGSNQEWALWALAQLDNSDEKIRLYEYLLRAHTFLMRYDERDLLEEYYFVKNQWLDTISSDDFDEDSLNSIQWMLDDENWTIDIEYPLDRPFALSHDEFMLVYFYFSDANPQFFLDRRVPMTMMGEDGLTPVLGIPAYYALAYRRQELYESVINQFEAFRVQIEQAIDMNNQLYIVKYVHDYVVNSLRYNFEFAEFASRQREAADQTILAFFGEHNYTLCKGYTRVIKYMLNRLGVPTIDQAGAMIVRDENGEIVDMVLHAWNIVQLEGEWFFMDATWETPGEERMWFLLGRGENNDSHFLWWHEIAYDMLYPEVAIHDFVFR